jgi:hypothetical protein
MFPDVIVMEDKQSPTKSNQLKSIRSSRGAAEPSRAEPSRAEPSRAEPSQAEQSQIWKEDYFIRVDTTHPCLECSNPLINDQKCTLLTRHLLGG